MFFLLHFHLSSKTSPSPTPPSSLLTILRHFRSGCQSALLIFKDPRAWNADSEHRPDFQSLILASRFPLEEDCFVFSLSHFLVTWQKGMEQAMEVLEMAKQINFNFVWLYKREYNISFQRDFSMEPQLLVATCYRCTAGANSESTNSTPWWVLLHCLSLNCSMNNCEKEALSTSDH